MSGLRRRACRYRKERLKEVGAEEEIKELLALAKYPERKDDPECDGFPQGSRLGATRMAENN